MNGNRKQFPGIETRHMKACASRSEEACNCRPSHRAVVHDPAIKRNRHGPWVKSIAQARGIQVDLKHKVRGGHLAAPDTTTVEQAGTRWLEAARAGAIRNSSGLEYKPSTLRSYESSFVRHVIPALGQTRLDKLRRQDVQELVDRLSLTMTGSTVRNAVMPLRVLCRRARQKDLIPTNPCDLLELPAADARRFVPSEDGRARETVATPEEAAQLIAALSAPMDQAIWAAAFYAGLRRGELRGLFLNDVDQSLNMIRVRRAWDMLDGEIATKSYAAERQVPLCAPLRQALATYLADHDGGEFLFPGYGRWGRGYNAFSADALLKRSRKVWGRAGLQPIGLHEARHTFASMLIDATTPIAKVSRYMGHASISMTERVYVHLLPNAHEEDLAVLDAYFARSEASPPASP